MPYQPDVRIMPALMALHECLCAELTKSGLDLALRVRCSCTAPWRTSRRRQ